MAVLRLESKVETIVAGTIGQSTNGPVMGVAQLLNRDLRLPCGALSIWTNGCRQPFADRAK